MLVGANHAVAAELLKRGDRHGGGGLAPVARAPELALRLEDVCFGDADGGAAAFAYGLHHLGQTRWLGDRDAVGHGGRGERRRLAVEGGDERGDGLGLRGVQAGDAIGLIGLDQLLKAAPEAEQQRAVATGMTM